MVAQMLLFCYVGPYPFSVQPSVHKMVLDYLARSSGEETNSEPTARAAVYGIGKCDSASLKMSSKNRYLRTLKQGKYSVADVVESIHIAFTNTPRRRH